MTRNEDKLSKEELEAAPAEIDKHLNSWKGIHLKGETGSGKSPSTLYFNTI